MGGRTEKGDFQLQIRSWMRSVGLDRWDGFSVKRNSVANAVQLRANSVVLNERCLAPYVPAVAWLGSLFEEPAGHLCPR
jgi:hypothetical protein